MRRCFAPGVLAALLQFFAAMAFAQAGLPSELVSYADLVLFDGHVLTADADRDFTVAEAVAVRGNTILAVGSSAKILRLAGPSTRRVDLHGRSVTPGFIYSDGDNSVPAGDLLKESQWDGWIQPNLGGETIDQALATLAFVVDKKSQDGKPMFFNLEDSWAAVAMKSWDISTLDEIAPTTPIAVYLDSSYSLVNTAMIELALEKGFPEDHFHLDRDANGKYTGRAGAQLSGFIGREVRPWPSPQWFDEVAVPGAIETLAKYARHGVTVATGHMSAATMTVLNRLFHRGDGSSLAIRVYPGLDFLRQNPEGERYLKRIGNLMDFSLSDERGPMVTIVGASVGPHSGSPDAAASLLTIEAKKTVIPDLSPNQHGYNRWTAEWFTGLSQGELTPEQQTETDYYNVMLARQHGWNVTGIHNMGSEAIRLAMQNVLAAEHQDNLYVEKLWRPQGFDHNIDWVPEVFEYYDAHPELKDLIRFGISVTTGIDQRDAKPLGIDNVIEAQYGKESLARMAPLHTLLEHGIPFHIEGTEPEDDEQYPTWYMQKVVTRVSDEGEVVGADEAIDREAALLALTRWAARFIGAEETLGSIEAGKLADLVVFDGNLMEVPIEHLADLKPVLTVVGGRIAWESPEL
ncbi:MAG TPA: amidohydrolase family protein [Woeseiaceae bacterium]|nr:amidohydrolase family protein [Woeseiaceae bacterium]